MSTAQTEWPEWLYPHILNPEKVPLSAFGDCMRPLLSMDTYDDGTGRFIWDARNSSWFPDTNPEEYSSEYTYALNLDSRPWPFKPFTDYHDVRHQMTRAFSDNDRFTLSEYQVELVYLALARLHELEKAALDRDWEHMERLNPLPEDS